MKKKLSLLSLIAYFIFTTVYALPNPTQDPRVQKVYNDLQGQLIWVKDGGWSTCGKTLLEALHNASDEGLWASDYEPIVNALAKADLSSLEGQKAADALLTLGALNYIGDMKGERLNPHLADKTIYINQIKLDEAELLKGYIASQHDCSWIQGLAPQTLDYNHLKELLAQYHQKQAQGGWPQLPKGTKLKKGDKGPDVKTLRLQLKAQDVFVDDTDDELFDEALEKAVKEYQYLHALDQDGRIGPGTLAALNTPVEERIRSIIVSLERQRWFPSPMPSRYLQVNIPGFYLKAVEASKPAFTMRVITGKEYTKTPVFNAEMKEIIFNPAWHVPTSIMNEIASKMERNPGGMAAKGYHYEGDRIVQSPGPANSLGKIRFTIESPFSIYLHGTPNENLFSKANRSLSHGCIRVQDPRKLAFFVFQDPEKWTPERIKEESSGSLTKHVKLENALPVFITYFTVFVNMDSKVHFVPDEYGQDKHIWRALESVKRK